MNKLTQHWSPILKHFKMNDFFYVLLDVDKTKGDPIITPSKYNIEMSMNTDERLEKLKSLSRKVKMRSEPSVNTLKVNPDIVIFQKYKIGDFLSVPVTILNVYDVSKPVRVVMDCTTTFSISYTSNVCSKIAPGMTYQFNINFNVREIKEYCHSLKIETDCETIQVLIVCIHPRPLLDIPDTITLPTTPVKTVAERVLLVRNMGDVPAIFNMVATVPFLVHPDRGILGPGKNLQLSVTFTTQTLGDHTGRLQISYETTEYLTVNLKACASEANITLEYTNIEIPSTYMGLKRRKFIKLFNNSSHLVHFKWKRYKDFNEAAKEYDMYKEAFKNVKELESMKWFGRVHQGIIDSKQTHEMIYDRIYQDELREYEMQEKFLYNNPNWAIHPLTGEVWPESSAMFILEFSPTHSVCYESTLYVEVAGKSDRIPLHVSGCGLGPSLELNLIELDANDIFLCAEHQYEVAVHNKGHIPGHIYYNPKPLHFCGNVSFGPASLYIDAGCYAAFVMKFSSKIQGKFVEDIEFVIKESEEVLKFVFKGNIICPLLNFDVADVDFSKVTLGYPVKKKIKLINTTQVPIEYKVSIVQDGTNPAITCKEYAEESSKPDIYVPKEFNFIPAESIVAPNFTLDGELTLLPNVEGLHTKRLCLIMWGTSKYSLTLPIRHKCMTPDIECRTKDIFMRGCFINYVYTRTVVLANLNEHPGYFMFIPQDSGDAQHIKYIPQVPEDFIDAYETKEVQLDISTSFVGQSTAHVYISVFGGKEKMFACSIRCNGQGPVITVPDVMNFDEIRTLREVSQTLEIINDSPVPATVTIAQNKKSVFKVSETRLELDPTEKKDMEVKVYLREPGRYSDKLVFVALNSENQVCSLYVRGSGSSILSEPELGQEFNLGYLLTHTQFSLPVKFTNMGKRSHKIIWSRIKKLKSFKEDPSILVPSVFSLVPCCFDLAPGQSVQCTLAGSSTTPGMVEEDFYCHALIENRKEFGVVSSFILTAHFVKPILELSKKEMKFRVDTTIDKSIAFLRDTLAVTNLSKLEVTVNVLIDPPFFIVQNDEKLSYTIVTLADGANELFVIEFVPRNEEKRCTIATGAITFAYMGHPNKDSIPLVGEENYPNLVFEPQAIDFGCLPNFYGTTQKMILKNISPLPVSFYWEWMRNDFNLNSLETKPINIGREVSEQEASFKPFSAPDVSKALQIQQYSLRNIRSQARKLHRRYELDLPHLPKHAAVGSEPIPIEMVIETDAVRSPQYFDKIQVYLYQLVHCYNDPVQYLETLKLLPQSIDDPEYIREVLDLIPTYGYLGPYESQVISFEFNPCPNTVVDAVAHCHLKGGITEVISIKGKSSNLSFSIESNIIEFGRQLFCETCEQKVIIQNTSHTDLQVQVATKPQKESEVDSVPPIGYYSVEVVSKDRDVEMTVRYFPGVSKEFNEPFIIQVGYLEPYTLTIHGFAMPAQAFCALPRPSLSNEKVITLSYKAIGKITNEILRTIKPLTQIAVRYKEDVHYNIRQHLKEQGWEYISYNDTFPTDVDIQMATEREAVDDLLQREPNILYTHISGKCVNATPNDVTFPYLIDFKYVVRDTVVHYTTTILNYGPLKNDIRLVYLQKNLLKYGFSAYISKSKLGVGESSDLVVIFNPSSTVFTTSNTEIKDLMYLSVPHGQKIPIEIRAIVTLPYINCEDRRINFDNVVLGNCVRKSIILENKGFVQSNWSAKIEFANGAKKDVKPLFFIKVTSGTLTPGAAVLYDVYFEPSSAIKFRASLILSVLENEEELIIDLRGTGCRPGIKITSPIVEFKSTLPYTQHVDATFTIENVGIFPMEFFFADFDDIISAEERVINVLMDLYRVNYLYLPERKPGETLPKAIYNFYQTIIDKVGQKIWEEELDKSKKEGSSDSIQKKRSENAQKSLSPKTSVRIKKSSRKAIVPSGSKILKAKSKSAATDSLPKLSEERASMTMPSLTKTQKKLLPAPSRFSMQDLLNRKTHEEIEQYIKEELLNWRITDRKPISAQSLFADPVKEAIEQSKPKPLPKASNDIKMGILIIFHGAPSTNYFQAAYRAGINLKLPVLTVDQLFLDAIISKDTLAAIKISELIEEAFRVIASDIDLIEPPDFDDHDRLQNMIDLLLTGKSKRTPKSAPSRGQSKEKAKSQETKSDKSDKVDKSKDRGSKDTAKESKTKIDKRPTFMGLPEDLLYELLEKKLLAYNKGLIIPSLDSLFLKQPLQVLNWILLSVKNMRYIHFILFSYTFHDYSEQTEAIKEQEEKNDVDGRREQVQAVIDMNAEEFENAMPEELEIFRNEVLIPRKANVIKKQEDIRYRISMKGKGIVAEKNKPKEIQKSQKSISNIAHSKRKKEGSEKDVKKDASVRNKGSSKGSKDKAESKSKVLFAKGKKPNPEELERKKNFDLAEDLAGEILHTLEYWNRETATLTKDFSAKSAKGPKSKAGGSASSKRSALNEMPVGQVKEFIEEDMKTALSLGIPCWFLNKAHCEKGFEGVLAMIDLLANNKEILFAQKEITEYPDEKLETCTEVFTVIQKPARQKRVANISEIFTLHNIIVSSQTKLQLDAVSTDKAQSKSQESSTSGLSLKKRTSSLIKKSKGSAGSVGSGGHRSTKSVNTTGISDSLALEEFTTAELTKRSALSPGEKMNFKVTFTPTKCGNYEHKYTIEIVGWSTKHTVTCLGRCDIPKLTIEPAVMFKNCYENRSKMKSPHNAYLLDEGIFEFGPILISSFANYTRVLEQCADILLQNDSSLPCNVQLVFLNTTFPPVTDIFKMSKHELRIESQQSEVVTISAQPSNVGNTTAQLAIIVSNNPRVELVNFNCLGVDFQFLIEPIAIIFERTLLNKMATKYLTFFNESLIPVIWKIAEPEEALQYFKIAPLKGSMAPCTRDKIQITFVAAVLEDIPAVELEIQILHGKSKLPIVLQVTTIELSAEVLNINVDCPREVNFGEVKARMEHNKEITILSKIKYNMELQFLPVDKYAKIKQDEEYRKLFAVKPDTLILSCDKPSTATITFRSKKCVDFTDVPVFKCTVVDPPSQNVMMTFVITGSAKTYLSSYELCPPTEIYFGHQLVGTEKLERLILRNTGKFDFTFTIMPLKEVLAQKARKSSSKVKIEKDKGKGKAKDKKVPKKRESSGTKSEGKGNQEKKGKKDKKETEKKDQPKLTTLDAGCFSVVSSTSQLQPHESTIITVTSNPRTLGLIEEIIIFFISECSVQDKKGIPVLLSVKGDTPSVDFTYTQDIFCEQYIVETVAEFNCPDQVGNHCYYVKNEHALYFSKTCINNTTTTRLRFQSTCAIVTELFAEILNGRNFAVKPKKHQLDAFEHIYLDVSFTPDTITSYSETLEVRYSTSIGESVRYNVELKGEGYVPELRIIEPMVDEISNTCWLIFNPVFVGKTQVKRIILENIGTIECKIMMEVADGSDMLLFRVVQEANAQCITKHSAVMTVEANSKAECEIEFRPTKDIKLDATINVFVVNNPFEFFCIQVIAESYIEDIILENISALSLADYKSNFKEAVSIYEIDFGCCSLNCLHKKLFKIKNNSILNIYRFEFPDVEKVVFIPGVGHLKPGSCKDVIVTFLSREPIMVQAEGLELITCQIQYLEPEIEPLSWDERQNMVTWTNESVIGTDPPKSSAVLSSHSQEGTSRKSSKGRVVKSANASLKARNKQSSKETIPETDVTSDSSRLKKKKVGDKAEPAHEVLAVSIKIITLLFSVNADYCNYDINVDGIEMEDTFMFEKTFASFMIKNISIMPMAIEWFIELDHDAPRKMKRQSSLGSTDRSTKSASTKRPQHPRKCICTPGVKYHLTGYEQFMHDQGKSSRPMTSYSGTESSWNAQDDKLPFTIEPEDCEIPPNADQKFTVTFAPIDAFDYLVHFKSCVPNIHPQAKPLDVLVKAKSLLPLYHFDIAPTDYLTNQRYGKKICGDLADKNTKVVEIEGIGLGINHVKSFHIMNPTGEGFDYQWKTSPVNTDEVNLFDCLTPKGHVVKGKLAKCSFSFLPQQLGIFEGFFTFVIEKYNLKTTFLLVGKAKNPCAFFSVPHLKLQPTLLRMVTSNNVILENKEDLELHFKIVKKSCFNGCRTDRVIVEPMEGNLGPKSEISMKIWCTPATTGELHFNLQCEIERMNKPLLLTVNTSAFEVEPVIYQAMIAGKVALDHKINNNTTLRTLIINQDDTSKFIIRNEGNIGFYYKWSKVDKFIDDFVKVTFNDIEGYCIADEERLAVVVLKPIRHLVEKNVKLKLNILYGPEYKINYICTTVKAKYKFSFTEYDFGPCLVQKEKTDLRKCFLQFSHSDDSPLLLEYRDDMLDHLTVVFKTKEIAPKIVETIPIYCHPLQPGNFVTPLLFSVNSKPERITIKAKGVLVELVLEDHDDRFVNFGPVLVGRGVSKTIKVINRTRTAINVTFNLYDMLPYFSKPKKAIQPEFERPQPPPPPPPSKVRVVEDKNETKSEKRVKKDKSKKDNVTDAKKSENTLESVAMKKSKSKVDEGKSKESLQSKGTKKSKGSEGSRKSKYSIKVDQEPSKTEEAPEIPAETPEERKERLIKQSLTISPKQSIKLPPGGKGGFIINYTPTERMQAFNKKVYCQVQDDIEPICIVQACCIAPEYYIDRNKISFGSVVRGCESESKFTLYNTGDIGGKYKWSIDKRRVSSGTKITICPMQGYISPDTSVTFLVKYQPTAVQCYIRVKVSCKIEKYNQPLDVILTGSCTSTPPPTATIEFICPVRSEVVQMVTVFNNTENKWKIHPQLTGTYFSVPDALFIEPNTSADCKVIYNPLVMTAGDAKHTAKLYFPQPNGLCSLYRLEGVAVAPEPIEKIEKEIFCKTYYTEILKIRNWSKSPQQFRVITENLKPEETVKILYKLTGDGLVDVAGSGEKDYYWGVYVLNVGALNFHVIFRNEKTNEYVLYKLELRVVQGGPQKEITLKACVRQRTSHVLHLENPITTPVIFNLKCTNPRLSFPENISVPPLTEETVTLSYLPLFVNEDEAILTIDTEELGQFLYRVFLIAREPVPETAVHLKCCLGQSSTQKVQIYNFTQTKCDYKMKISDSEAFTFRPETLLIDPQVKGQFEVTFQPVGLGSFDGTLKISSVMTGEYIYPLRGICELPKPQGPIKVPVMSTAFITFKNPFTVQAKFEFLTESKVFHVSTTSETLFPLASTKIEVYMKIVDPIPTLEKYPCTGKLTVVCVDPPMSNIKWVYYLQSQ